MARRLKSKPLTFAILGDSAATGVGDYDLLGRTRGWCVHLANAFNQTINVVHVARSGAQSSEVLKTQLPRALSLRPDLAAIVVGGNDALRNGFCPHALYENLKATISEIKSNGGEVLMLQLHDPTKIVPMPKLLKRVLLRRVDSVNAVYEKLSQEYNFLLLKTRNLPNIYDLKLWHFDRMHPSTYGHLVIAKYFRDALAERGWDLSEVQLPESQKFAHKDRVMWMLKNGTPWFFKRSFDLLPAATLLMVWELLRITYEKINRGLIRN